MLLVLLVFLLVGLPLLHRVIHMVHLITWLLGLWHLKEVAPILVGIRLIHHMVLCQCGHGEGVV